MGAGGALLGAAARGAARRAHPPREALNGLRYSVRTGAPWRASPNDPPPWHAVYGQARRWLAAGCFERLAHDLRALLRATAQRDSKAHMAVDTLGHLLALHVIPATADDRAEVGRLA